MKRYTPTTFEEMIGMKQTVAWDTILMAATDYKMMMFKMEQAYQNVNHGDIYGHCSGFVGVTEESMLLGQTQDFNNLNEWFSGKMDIVLHHIDSETGLQSLFYTDPGFAIMMGMNSEGLVLLWQTIDDGSRAQEYEGVPSHPAAREAMKYTTLEDAVDFLCSIPMAVPNNFILGQARRDSEGMLELGFYDLEASPPAGCTRVGTKSNVRDRYLVHTNHILFDLNMLDRRDILRNYTSVHHENSVARYNALHKRLKMAFNESDFSVERLKNIYSSPPLLRANQTMATMIYEPIHLKMNIRFRGEDWRVFEFDP